MPVAANKIEGPATTITFLGVTVDTVRSELRLPQHKLEYIRGLVSGWRGRRSGTYREFQSLIGHLAHATTVIRQGRIFLKHLYTILAGTHSDRHHVHLDAVAKADLLWWEKFLHQWSGMSFYLYPPTPSFHIYTDASGFFGCGGVWPPSWCFESSCNGQPNGRRWALQQRRWSR